MRRPSRATAVTVLTAVSVILGVVGNFVGNPVADLAPISLRWLAFPLLVLATGAIIVVGQSFSALQVDATTTSPRLRRTALLLTAISGALATIGGILSGVVTASLPAGHRPWSLALFFMLAAITIMVSLALYALQTSRDTVYRDRFGFLRSRHEQYRKDKEAALGDGDAEWIPIRLRDEPSAVSPGGEHIGPHKARQAHAQQRAQPTNQPTDPEDATPVHTDIMRAYRAAQGQLLILGPSGGGKSTILVELALRLAREAQLDEQQPIPVIFNLSGWALERAPLEDWMSRELVYKYGLERSLAAAWVTRGAIAPLLDGLDEGRTDDARDACIQAINDYHAQCLNIPLVVCSRVAEYSQRTITLALQAAVVVEPLTDAQIEAYLARGGQHAAGLITRVRGDAKLRAAVRTPLILYLVKRAYGSRPDDAKMGEEDAAAWRQRLVGDYVAATLQRPRRREDPGSYTPGEVTAALTWLAAQMIARLKQARGLHRQYLQRLEFQRLEFQRLEFQRQERQERQEPQTPELLRLWERANSPRARRSPPLEGDLPSLSLDASWHSAQLAQARRSPPREVDFSPPLLDTSWLSAPARTWYALIQMIVGISWRVALGVIAGLIAGQVFGAPAGILFGLGIALGFHWFISNTQLAMVYLNTIPWLIMGIVTGLVFGGVCGVSAGLCAGLLGGATVGVITGVGVGVIGFVFAAAWALLLAGGTAWELIPALVVAMLIDGAFAYFWRSGLPLALVLGLLPGMIFNVVGVYITEAFSFVLDVVFDVLDDAFHVSYANQQRLRGALQRVVVRWTLWLGGTAPLRLDRFLDFAVDRALLKKIGDSYQFFHPIFLDYFAALGGVTATTEPEQPARAKSGAKRTRAPRSQPASEQVNAD
jgi:hypothetical protein